MLGVVGVFAVGRRLWGAATGVAAAAVLAFAFLPVAYSRFALTDTGVLLPVAAALYGAVRAARGRSPALVRAVRRRDRPGGGLQVHGRARRRCRCCSPPCCAPGRTARRWPASRWPPRAGAVVFFATNPFFFFDLRDALTQLEEQSVAASGAKLGQGDRSGPSYYLGSLTWGLGWGARWPRRSASCGSARRNRTRALLLAVFPVLLFLYLCTAGALLRPLAAADVSGAGPAGRHRPGRARRPRAGPPVAARRRCSRCCWSPCWRSRSPPTCARATCSTAPTRACWRASSCSRTCRDGRASWSSRPCRGGFFDRPGRARLHRAAGGARGGRHAAALHPLARAAAARAATAARATARC